MSYQPINKDKNGMRAFVFERDEEKGNVRVRLEIRQMQKKKKKSKSNYVVNKFRWWAQFWLLAFSRTSERQTNMRRMTNEVW